MWQTYAGGDTKRKDSLYYIAREAFTGKNQVLAADIISTMCMLPEESIDCKGIAIDGGYFTYLSFEGKEIQKLTISNSIIEKMDLTNSRMADSVEISDCIISTIYGISSRNSIPSQFHNCEVKQFEMLATSTLVKRARLSEPQKILVRMIRKIFFQPGAGRKESTLLRETEGVSTKKSVRTFYLH